MRYEIGYIVEGLYKIEVEAESIEEAREKANSGKGSRIYPCEVDELFVGNVSFIEVQP